MISPSIRIMTQATDVLPLLILIYGILAVAILYGIVVFVQQRRQKLSSSIASEGKVRDTVNNKEIKTAHDNLISIYEKKMLELNAQMSTGAVLNKEDIVYLLSQLRPNSTVWDVLCICLTTPSTMEWATTDYNRVHVLRHQRAEQDKQEKEEEANKRNQQADATANSDGKNNVDVFDDLFNNDAGWDNEDDDDENHTKRQSAPSNSPGLVKTTTTNASTAATNKKVLLEGFDPHVLGQQWVERALQSIQVWPPKDFGVLQNRTFAYFDPLTHLSLNESTSSSSSSNGSSTGIKKSSTDHQDAITTITSIPNSQFQIMEHPPLRRTMCMIMARFNSVVLNNHAELIDAGLKQLIDQTYFKSSMEFRNRMNMILETSIQMAMLLQSFPLLCTILNTITAFKIGLRHDDDAKTLPYFNTMMTRQYQILPRLKINATTIRQSKANSDDATNENVDDTLTTTSTMYLDDSTTTPNTAEIILDVERIHAQQFLKVKVKQYEEQNIPPQIGLQNYRERWWFMLRMKPLGTSLKDATTTMEKSLYQPIQLPPDAKFTLDPKVKQVFEDQPCNDRLLTAWPLTITNVAQQRGQVKIQFAIPKVAGQYKYCLHIHSSDFLGAHHDEEFQLNVIPRPATGAQTTVEPKKEK